MNEVNEIQRAYTEYFAKKPDHHSRPLSSEEVLRAMNFDRVVIDMTTVLLKQIYILEAEVARTRSRVTKP
jgi:hypothetical protein